jgi:MoxR-like ATPase
MLTEQTGEPPLETLQPVTTAGDIVALAEEARNIYVDDSLNRYVVALLRATRSDPRLYLGASPRAGIALLRVAKARALADGREYLSPDDIKGVAAVVLAHRLIVAPEARSSGVGGDAIVRDVLDKTPVPV